MGQCECRGFVHAGRVDGQEFHRVSATPLGRLTSLAVLGAFAALVWVADSEKLPRWIGLGLAALLAVSMAFNWVRWRGERWFLTPTELRRESRVRSEALPLDQLTEVTYPLSGGRVRMLPRVLWLTAGRTTFLIGHPGTWRRGEWELLLTGLAPWMVRAPRIDKPSRQLLTSITGCVSTSIPDGRPVSEQPAVNRHPHCPRPDLCNPHHERS